MKTLLNILLFLFISCKPEYPNIHQYVIENTHPINSISPYSSEFDDLRIFDKNLAKAKIVLLGEQDHGDAPAFLFKTRLVKYLHEVHDFNILVFESDFFGLHQLNEMYDKPSVDSIQNNIYNIWSNCAEVSELFNYYSKNKIKIYGLDSRLKMPYSQQNFMKFLRTVNSIEADSSRFYSISEKVLKHEYEDHPTVEDKEFFFSHINELIEILPAGQFKKNAIINFREYANNAWNGWEIIDIRDKQMAKNLIWLSEKFKREKIIVWAANVHISKSVELTFEKNILNDSKVTMGTELTKYFKENKIYHLGFTSFSGKAGRISLANKYSVAEPHPNGLETWIHQLGIKTAFIDFNAIDNSNLSNQSFHAKGYFHAFSHNLPWAKIYDGMVFINDMYPCSEVE